MGWDDKVARPVCASRSSENLAHCMVGMSLDRLFRVGKRDRQGWERDAVYIHVCKTCPHTTQTQRMLSPLSRCWQNTKAFTVIIPTTPYPTRIFLFSSRLSLFALITLFTLLTPSRSHTRENACLYFIYFCIFLLNYIFPTTNQPTKQATTYNRFCSCIFFPPRSCLPLHDCSKLSDTAAYPSPLLSPSTGSLRDLPCWLGRLCSL
jgi:hypothetical protein